LEKFEACSATQTEGILEDFLLRIVELFVSMENPLLDIVTADSVQIKQQLQTNPKYSMYLDP
jgi:hypothetical protein